MDEERVRPSRDEMLERVPLELEIAPEVDLEADDPAYSPRHGRRLCIAVRRAGGRCATPPTLDHVLCAAHAGTLDPRLGGLALARKRREQSISQEERSRLARLGARGAIAEALARRAADLQKVVDTLVDAAAAGDLASAKLLGPYLNQGLGLPEQRVEAHVATAGDISEVPTAQLLEIVRSATPQVDAEQAS